MNRYTRRPPAHTTPILPHRELTARPAPVAVDQVDVSVVVVTYNVREFLAQALESIRRAGRAGAGLSVETIVVDNDSADGTAAMVRSRFPEVNLIENRENVGFARANNEAIRAARGRHILVLNPDTLVQEDTLRALVAFMDEHPDAGAAGCRILNPDGSFAPESRRAFPTPSVALYRLTGLSRLFPRSPVFGRYNLTYLPKDRVCEVDALSGSCMMVRAEAIWGRADDSTSLPRTGTGGAGLLDEDFFMYGEDLDWCFRIQQAGWRIYYTPDTQIIHYKGESTKKGELRYVRLFYGAMLRFAEKHFRPEVAGRPFRRLSLRLLSIGLHGAIVARGAVSAGSRLGRWVAAPVSDLVLATLAFGAGSIIGGERPAAAAPDALVAAAVVVLGIAAFGGYMRRRRAALRPAVAGLFAALVVVLAVAFVAPSLAPGRRALVIGGGLAALALVARRHAARRVGTRRAVVVGSAVEAARLHRLVADRPRPAVHVVGHVSDEEDTVHGSTLLGPPRQLRDLVRLHDVDEVVFAADSLSNTTILGLMRRLADLPVQLKILAAGHDRVIGKASVEDFSLPLRAAEDAVAPLRASLSRRAFALVVACIGTALHPVLRLSAQARPTRGGQRLADVAGRMPAVLKGRLALVGYGPGDHHPPQEWGLEEGAVSVLDALPRRPSEISEAQRAYWFYVRHPSVALDAEVLFRALARSNEE